MERCVGRCAGMAGRGEMTFARDFALWEGGPRTSLNAQWMEYGRWMAEAKDRARDALAEGNLDKAIAETRWAIKYMFCRKGIVEQMKWRGIA